MHYYPLIPDEQKKRLAQARQLNSQGTEVMPINMAHLVNAPQLYVTPRIRNDRTAITDTSGARIAEMTNPNRKFDR